MDEAITILNPLTPLPYTINPTGSAMALVACTQLKELDLRYTELTGEWFVVGIDRGPVPSEQRSNERAVAHQNY